MMFTLGLLLQYLSPRVRPTHDISKMSQTSLESNMSLKIQDISKGCTIRIAASSRLENHANWGRQKSET